MEKPSVLAECRQAEFDAAVDAIFDASKVVWKLLKTDWTGIKVHPLLAFKLGELMALVIIQRGKDDESGLTLGQVAEHELELEQKLEQKLEQPNLLNESGDLVGEN
jgi:hypothetical protein